ncbi:hypothetical protein [Rhizobium leguminosarum]|uniref:hypothetical protein n=1 Tax=Rhizobium leguminosarum TaxID=384 RepID=UPI0010409C16|nr:hypothetical protein [Rhizobium leguminosarum]TBZ94477.1 hypothetical protein E0H63_33590 [Rhizobium leguminosarum bv. viciae]
MTWLIPIIIGAFAPWIVMTDTLRIAFARSVWSGIAVWSGMAVFTIPFMFGFIYVTRAIF